MHPALINNNVFCFKHHQAKLPRASCEHCFGTILACFHFNQFPLPLFMPPKHKALFRPAPFICKWGQVFRTIYVMTTCGYNLDTNFFSLLFLYLPSHSLSCLIVPLHCLIPLSLLSITHTCTLRLCPRMTLIVSDSYLGSSY